MTYKNGLIIGASVGFVIWLICNGILAFTPAPEMGHKVALVIFSFMLVMSFIVGVGSALKGSAVFKTTGDGFFFGFTAVFDGLYILIQFATGNWFLFQPSIILIIS